MEKNITIPEAYEAYFLTKSPKSTHSTLLLKKTGSKKLSRLFDCMDTNTTKALKKTPECAELSVSYSKLSNGIAANEDEARNLLELIKEISPEKAAKINKMIAAKNAPPTNMSDVMDIYFDVSKNFRIAILNKEITLDDKIYKDARLKRLVKWGLFDKNSSTISNTLSNIECKNIQDADTLFFEALL
jgi:hypothetical protein